MAAVSRPVVRHAAVRAQPHLSALRPGEGLAASYETAGAPCGCPATHHWHGFLSCLPVARSRTYDRCLTCGATWTRRRYTWQPAALLTEAA